MSRRMPARRPVGELKATVRDPPSVAGGRERRFLRLLPAAVSLVIIAVAGTVLWKVFDSIEFADVARDFNAIPTTSIVLAALLTVSACLAVAAYEVAMLRYLQSGLPDRLAAFTALTAFPIGHAIGFGALSGGAVRYRFYSAAGLSAFSIGKVVVLSVFPFAMGLGLLCGLAFLTRSTDGARLLMLDERWVVVIGGVLIFAHAAYLTLVLRVRGPVALRGFELELPSHRLTAIQYLLGIVEVLAAVGVLYLLLPEAAGVSFLPFAAAYVIAIVAGLLSSVPAGLGVFESMLLLLLRDLDPEALLGSVLAYRLIYELAPFMLAILLLLGWEAWSRRHLLGRRRS